MSDKNTQYGTPVFIESFGSGTAKPMKRISFSKNTPNAADYDEKWLQRLIMHHPRLLPVDQIEPAFADLVPICTELPTPSGPLDNLFVTASGNIALVECKLWRNPEARREVIGQIIDYAKDLSSWTYERLQAAISRARFLDAADSESQRSLYSSVSANCETDEASFVDAVSRNLRRGRFLLLIVGDGIREGVESMIEFLQQYAGLHFTLALVELALFEVQNGGYLVQPRVLARTTNIDRGIVTIGDDDRISIRPTIAPTSAPIVTVRNSTITSELFFEKIDGVFNGMSQRLNRFVEKLSIYGIETHFGSGSMILKWPDDATRTWTLGVIRSSGSVLTDNICHQADGEGLLNIGQDYLEDLAALVPGAYVRHDPKGKNARSVFMGDRTVTVESLLASESREDGWVGAVVRFQTAVRKSMPSERPSANTES